MKARYKYRFYPTNQQKKSLAQLFGCVRVVFNDALALCKKSQKLPKTSKLSNKVITQAKKTKDRAWLSQVSSVALQQSVRDLGIAYKNFFDSLKGKRKGIKIRSPKFKKRRNQQTARLTRNAFSINNESVYLAKIGIVKPVWSREIPSVPSSVTIIKDSANRYFLSFVVEIEKQPAKPTNKTIGIDLGIKTFATFDTGEKIDAPKPLKKNLKRLRKLQRHLSRKRKGSKRYEQSRLKVAKLHAKIKDLRSDFLHKLSTEIIRENQTIVLEDLNVSGMIKKRCDPAPPKGARERAPRDRKLSRAISDLGWREFRTFLEAKAEKYERDFRVIDRWEPTSQTCSSCGFRGGKLDLSIREWQCLNCETTHDRDVNAAINIKVAGGLRETLNGRGERRKTSVEAAFDETSTHQEFTQLSLFG